MCNKRCVRLWLFMALLMFNVPASAQRSNLEDRERGARRQIQEEHPIPTEEQILRQIDSIISRGDNNITADALGFFMADFSTFVDSVKS
ncbi:MAG: hypothetical protein JSU85_03950, partial [Candidatus Zixiibacteriota bacterium]